MKVYRIFSTVIIIQSVQKIEKKIVVFFSILYIIVIAHLMTIISTQIEQHKRMKTESMFTQLFLVKSFYVCFFSEYVFSTTCSTKVYKFDYTQTAKIRLYLFIRSNHYVGISFFFCSVISY